MGRRPIFRGRVRRPGGENAGADEVLEIDPDALSGMFAAPTWMRDLGFSAWLLVGVAAALIGTIWLLSLTQTIVMPVLTAAIIASVTSPLVDGLRRHGVPRGIGAGIVFLAIVAIGLAVGLLVLTGIASQAESLSERLREGASEVEGLLRDLGVSAPTAADANADGSSSISAGFEALTHGLIGGIDKLASLAVFLSFTALSLFFMLKDAPTIGGFVERHLGVPVQLGHSILARVTSSLRGYFLGVTVVAAWSALLVGAGALLLDFPFPARSRRSRSWAGISPTSAPGQPGSSRCSSHSEAKARRPRWRSPSSSC